FSFEYLLLSPIFALRTVPSRLCHDFFTKSSCLPTRQSINTTLTVRYGYHAQAPSIFRASSFG
ncbi:14771_t:CDS:1, partial [Acaulospora morrowiae]